MLLLAALLLPTAAGCGRADDVPGTSRATSALGGTGITAPGPTEPAASAALRTSLPKESQVALSEAPFPVLVPGSTALASKTKIMRGPKWAGFELHEGDVTISLTGTQTVHAKIEPENLPPKGTVRGVTAWTGMNEGMPFISWQEAGTAWMLEVECASRVDTRCTREMYISELVASLVSLSPNAAAVKP